MCPKIIKFKSKNLVNNPKYHRLNISMNKHDINILLKVKCRIGTTIISIKKIRYIEASNKSSIIYIEKHKPITTIHLIKWYESQLPNPEFFRCHKSFIVNCLRIDYYCKGFLILDDNYRIPFSRSKKDSIISILEYLQKKYQ